MTTPMRALAVACLLAVALAGCLGGAGPSDSPAAGPGLAVQPGVDDPGRYVVNVTEATRDGPPVAGATVVFFNVTATASQPFYVRPGELSCTEPVNLTASSDWDVLAVGTTDEAGQVVGRLDPDARMVSVAATAPGYTTEASLHAFTDGVGCVDESDSGESPWADGGETVRLFRRRRPVAIEGAMNASASAAFLGANVSGPTEPSEPVWDAAALPFHEDRHANVWYSRRLTGLDLDLTWNNTATASADLYLAAGHDTEAPPTVFGSDARQQPADGPSRETLTVERVPWSPGYLDVIGPATNRTVAADDGLDWRISGEATFRGVPLLLPGDR